MIDPIVVWGHGEHGTMLDDSFSQQLGPYVVAVGNDWEKQSPYKEVKIQLPADFLGLRGARARTRRTTSALLRSRPRPRGGLHPYAEPEGEGYSAKNYGGLARGLSRSRPTPI
jgi:hypothetical protein